MLVALREILPPYSSAKLYAWYQHKQNLLDGLDSMWFPRPVRKSDIKFVRALRALRGSPYWRAFVIACGHHYYEAFKRLPRLYTLPRSCEDLLYLAGQIHLEKFGTYIGIYY